MDYCKKTIILSPAIYDGKPLEKGVLTIENNKGNIKGQLKCFNMPEFEGKTLVGITTGGSDLHKFDLTGKSLNSFIFNLGSSIDLNKKISCVLVNIYNSKSNPIIWGSTETNKLWKADCLSVFKNEEVQVSNFESEVKDFVKKPENINYFKQTKKAEEENIDSIPAVNNDIVDNLKEELDDDYINSETILAMDAEMGKYDNEKQIDKEVEKQKMDFNEHKQVFNNDYVSAVANSNVIKKEEKSEYISYENLVNMDENILFYDQVKEQVEELFAKFPEELSLQEIIPNSKFVRVDFEEDGDYYIFGVIYDDNEQVEYLVYGMPAIYSNEPPNDLEGFYQWLPLDINKPEEEGFWMMYQDAKSGENIKVEMV